MQASLEPVVEHPVASEPPRACHNSARMLTQRDSSSAVCAGRLIDFPVQGHGVLQRDRE
jgi:hypothetical protein